MVKPPACALILLAAGAATRMGQPKQLLAVQGQPLLRYLVEKSLTVWTDCPSKSSNTRAGLRAWVHRCALA